jgi:phage shock protein C
VSDRPATRLLRRSRDDRVIAGVCGGLGRYLQVDPVLLRIALVILTVSGGLGVLCTSWR